MARITVRHRVLGTTLKAMNARFPDLPAQPLERWNVATKDVAARIEAEPHGRMRRLVLPDDPYERQVRQLRWCARRLHALGLLGSGTIGVQLCPDLHEKRYLAVAMPQVGQILLHPGLWRMPASMQRETLVHELLHLAQPVDAWDETKEATSSCLAVFLLRRWGCPASEVVDRKALGLPAVYLLGRLGGERRAFLPWLVGLHRNERGLERIEDRLKGMFSKRSQKALFKWARRFGGDARAAHNRGHHTNCVHSLTEAVAMVQGALSEGDPIGTRDLEMIRPVKAPWVRVRTVSKKIYPKATKNKKK